MLLAAADVWAGADNEVGEHCSVVLESGHQCSVVLLKVERGSVVLLKVLSRALKCFKSVERGSVVLESGEKCSAYNLSKHCSDIAARPVGLLCWNGLVLCFGCIEWTSPSGCPRSMGHIRAQRTGLSGEGTAVVSFLWSL